jgi:hypothetical protein
LSVNRCSYRPAEWEQLNPSQKKPIPPVYDTALEFLASHAHPQQRRQLLHDHQQKLQKFYHDSNLQWDEAYPKSRYSEIRGLQNIYATPEILKNIQTSGGLGEVGGNAPSLDQPADLDGKTSYFSINELQLYLSDQAMLMRQQMKSEYEDLRRLQNAELELMLKAKMGRETEFAAAVELARKEKAEETRQKVLQEPRTSTGSAHGSAQMRPPLRRGSTNTAVYGVPTAAPQQQNLSPLVQSPSESADINDVLRNKRLPPFVRFCAQLEVIQRNWLNIRHNWLNFVDFFERHIFKDDAFAKAIIVDAFRDAGEMVVDRAAIETARKLLEGKIPGHMSQVIARVLFEMAEEGHIDFRDPPVEPLRHGTSILSNAIMVEREFVEMEEASKVGKATDPRQRF